MLTTIAWAINALFTLVILRAGFEIYRLVAEDMYQEWRDIA